MLKHITIALVWLACISAMFACVAAMKSNGATEHPLLVQSSAPTMGDEAEANQLLAPCPLTPRNLPLRADRSA